MSDNETPSPNSPDEILPPVQPPSAGFLMQLFIIPLVIVGVIVSSALAITWLAKRGADPDKLFDDLNSSNAGSWQKALDIANLLTDPRNEELRKSEKIATKLEDLLAQQLEEGGMRPKEIEMRVYLCSSLGRMEVKGRKLDTLAKAIQREVDPQEIKVRIAATVAITRRIENESISRESVRDNALVMDALKRAANATSEETESKRRHGLLRETAVYALGVIGGEQALEEVASALVDARPTVRFNAAVALARNGDARSVDRLSEMLDLDLELNDAEGRTADDATRSEILRTAVMASFELLKKNSNFPEAETLKEQLRQIGESDRVISSIQILVTNGFAELSS